MLICIFIMIFKLDPQRKCIFLYYWSQKRFCELIDKEIIRSQRIPFIWLISKKSGDSSLQESIFSHSSIFTSIFARSNPKFRKCQKAKWITSPYLLLLCKMKFKIQKMLQHRSVYLRIKTNRSKENLTSATHEKRILLLASH